MQPTQTIYRCCHPFGMVMPGRSWTAASAEGYRFGYQGSISTSEINVNHYNTFFRELDSRLGKWWTIDPYNQITPWESPYISMGNNPIINNDIYGNIWDNASSKSQADGVKAEATELKAEEQAYQQRLQTKINDRLEKGKNITNLQNLMSESKQNVKEYDAAISEIDALTNSKVTYSIDNTFKTQANGVTGDVIYNSTNKSVVIRYDLNNGFPIATLAHELKHGYQFETGQIDLRSDGTGGGSLVDLTDEVAAYRREFAFASNSLPTQVNKFSSINQTYVRKLGYKSAFGPINHNTSLELINHNRIMAGRDRLWTDRKQDGDYLLKTTYSEWSEDTQQTQYINIFNYK